MILTDWLIHRGTASPARAGQVHGIIPGGSNAATVLTPDSDLGFGPDPDVRVYRVDGKHWLPPEIAGKMYGAATWQLEIGYTGDGSDGLGTSFDESWTAGTVSRVTIAEGRTATADNDPGWQSLSEALADLRYPKPEPEDDQYWDILGFGGIFLTVEGTVDESPASLEVECRIGRIFPAFYASAPPSSPGIWNPGDLEPVWWVSMIFQGRAYIDGGLVSQTDLGTFDGHEIGRVGAGDSDWSLALSIASEHTSV